MMRRILLVLALLIPWAAALSAADGMLMSWGPQDLEGMTEARWAAARARAPQEILRLNRELTTWPEAYEVLVGTYLNPSSRELLDGLVQQLSDPKETALQQTGKLIIWDRIASGQILFVGTGMHVEDDLFRVAGRANWVLRMVLKKNFGYVRRASGAQDLEALRKAWAASIEGKPVPELVEPYPSANRGLDELRSPGAIPALIASLLPSAAKDEHVLRCSQRHGPEDRLCNPDNLALTYLGKITGVAEPHPHEWWARWWAENGARLRWSPESAMFRME
jgi:hypothetical protein